MTLRAFGGGELKGEKLVKFAYLDESGIGNPDNEPFIVIAGVMVDPDSQWRALHDHFQDLIARFSPHKNNDGVILHAKDIWQGNKTFDRKIWDFKRRKELLRELCLTISKFDLPVVYGESSRETVKMMFDTYPAKKPKEFVKKVAYMASFAECALSVDTWMKRNTSNELVSLVIENNNELRKYAKMAYKEFRKDEFKIPGQNEDSYSSIIDTPTFMDKDEAPPLQLADLCAFIMRRVISGKEDMEEYMRILHPYINEV